MLKLRTALTGLTLTITMSHQRLYAESNVSLWCDISSNSSPGPHILEEVSASGVISCFVTSDGYKSMFQKDSILDLHQRNGIIDIVPMQDGTQPHVSESVTKILWCLSYFPSHCGIISPTWFLGLAPMDLWFWDFLKSKVCTVGLHYLSELNHIINHKIMQISPVMLFLSFLSKVSRI